MPIQAAHDHHADQALMSTLHSMLTFSADLAQTTEDEQHHVIQESKGHLLIAQPKDLRLDTYTPSPQTLLIHMPIAKDIDPELEQVTLRHLEHHSEAMMAHLLLQPNQIHRYFHITLRDNHRNKTFVLTPKTTTHNLMPIELILKKHMIDTIITHDALGQKTTLRLSHIVLNPHLNTNAFRYTIPKHWDIINASKSQ